LLKELYQGLLTSTLVRNSLVIDWDQFKAIMIDNQMAITFLNADFYLAGIIRL
jgi:hypothetical protein